MLQWVVCSKSAKAFLQPTSYSWKPPKIVQPQPYRLTIAQSTAVDQNDMKLSWDQVVILICSLSKCALISICNSLMSNEPHCIQVSCTSSIWQHTYTQRELMRPNTDVCLSKQCMYAWASSGKLLSGRLAKLQALPANILQICETKLKLHSCIQNSLLQT